jgi:predicted permease
MATIPNNLISSFIGFFILEFVKAKKEKLQAAAAGGNNIISSKVGASENGNVNNIVGANAISESAISNVATSNNGNNNDNSNNYVEIEIPLPHSPLTDKPAIDSDKKEEKIEKKKNIYLFALLQVIKNPLLWAGFLGIILNQLVFGFGKTFPIFFVRIFQLGFYLLKFF